MQIHLANAEWLAARAMADVLEPPPPVDYLAWAEQNIVFSSRESAFAGPYNRALFGYFDEVLRALSPDDPCRIVTLAKSAQLGGTVLANIFVGGSLAMDPGDVLYVHPTADNAARWSKMKLAPFLRSTACLAVLFDSRSRDGSDSVLYKERRDGRGALQISGANSPASLSQVTMRRQVQDDLAKWDVNTAGDPESQADSRSRAHEFAKIFKVSTPLVMPGCRITRNFEAGSQEYPYVPCPHCNEMQVLEWDNMLAHLDEERPEKAHFVCTACGCAIEEHHRPQMLAGLEWRARNPAAKREHRSFWIWSAYSYLQSWERIAREWLKAKGDPASEQTFSNDTVGVAYRGQSEAVPWEALRDRAAESPYVHGELPSGALFVTAGVDCQGNRVEWQVVAWGRERRRWIIAYGVIPGHISEAGCQEKLDGLLAQTFRNCVGRRIGIDLLAIDGNAYTEEVWSWAKRHPSSRVIMVRGRKEEHIPLIEKVKRETDRAGRKLKYSKRFYNFATSVMKMALYRNLAKLDPLERGYIALPRGLDDEFYRQLTAERRVPKRKRDGFIQYEWEKDPTQANEGLDTHLQAEAAANRLGIRDLSDALWDKVEAERETPPAPEQGDIEDLLLRTSAPAEPPPPETPTRDSASPVVNTFVSPRRPGSWHDRG